MIRLLDHIFHNLEERDLNRSQITAYICYLDELILGGLSLPKELAYQAIKIQLTKRLNALDQDSILFQQKNQEDKAS